MLDSVIRSTTFLASGTANAVTGQPIINDTPHALIHLVKKSGAEPMFTNVTISDMRQDMKMAVESTNTKFEYLAGIRIAID